MVTAQATRRGERRNAAESDAYPLRESAVEVLTSFSRTRMPTFDLSPAVTFGRWRLRDATALPLEHETERREMFVPSPKRPQDYIDRAEACEKLAETALSAETRETMRYLALSWRTLAAETEAKLQASDTRKPISERPST